MRPESIVDITTKTGNDFDQSYLNFARFKHLGTEYFGIGKIETEPTLENKFKKIVKYNLFKLPIEFNEFFIGMERPSRIFLLEYYYLNEAAKKSHLHRKFYFGNKKFEEYFVKWVTLPNQEARLFYAKTLIEKIQSDYTKMMNNIVAAFIYSEEELLLDLDKASELMKQAIEQIEKFSITDKIKSRILYILHIYLAIILIKNNLIDECVEILEKAKEHNKWASVAKYYLAYAHLLEGDTETAYQYFSQVFQYDWMRLKFFITTNQLTYFKFFLNNNITQNIFFDAPFSHLYEHIYQLVTDKENTGDAARQRVIKKFEGLTEKKTKNHLSESHQKDLVFIKKMIDNYKTSNNIWILITFELLEEKVDNIIDAIIKTIRENYETKLQAHIRLYDEKISDNQKKVEQFKQNIKLIENRLKMNMEEDLKAFEKKVEMKVQQLKLKLEAVENSKNQETIKTFSNSMLYTAILSVFIFLTGGFAEYTNSYIPTESNFATAISIIILKGIKWGIISFVIGLFISTFISISTVFSNITRKQKILRQINKSDTILKYGKSRIEKEYEERRKLQTESNNSLIKTYLKNIENLKQEKESKIKKLKKEYDENLEKETAPFMALKLIENE